MSRNKRGFSLVELMVVIVIIGILASIVGVHVMGRIPEAHKVKAKADFSAISNGIKYFKLNCHSYPESLADLIRDPGDMAGWSGPYLDKPPIDPWERPYKYRLISEIPGYEIYTLGADDQEGGEEEDEDNRDFSNLDQFRIGED